MSFTRIDQSPVARWWWTVDRWTLVALAMLIVFGALLSMAASPAVAVRLRYGALPFLRAPPGDGADGAGDHVRACRCLSPRMDQADRDLSASPSRCVALLLTFFIGVEIKGARRWIDLPGLSLQPSEFVKPTFAVVAACAIFGRRCGRSFPGGR